MATHLNIFLISLNIAWTSFCFFFFNFSEEAEQESQLPSVTLREYSEISWQLLNLFPWNLEKTLMVPKG